MRCTLSESAWRQTLHAALVGVVMGASFGLVTALAGWACDQFGTSPATTEATEVIAAAIGLGFLPGTGIVQAIQPLDGAEAEEGCSPGRHMLMVLCNTLFWAALWALLLAWPGLFFTLGLALCRLWEELCAASARLYARARA